MPQLPPRPAPRALAISDRRSLAGDLLDWLRTLAGAGIEAVQLREKDLDDRALYDLARTVRELLPPAVRLLVNGRADIARAAGADGVHLPADALPVAALRRRFGPNLLIGRSTHTAAEVADAVRQGVDYVTFGPVYPSPGKGEPTGLEALAAVARLGVPVLALGGVTLARLQEIAAAGAAGVAGIRCFQDPNELAALLSAARLLFGVSGSASPEP